MATLCSTYATAASARSGVDALRTAGVPGGNVRLLIGHPVRDTRREPVGGFAGPVGPNAPVGTFANVRRLRRQGTGSFAGAADRRRKGSFADIDRDLIVTRAHDGWHSHIVGDLALRRVLRGADFDDAERARVLDELRAGHAVIVAELADVAPRDAQPRLDRRAQEA